MNIEYMNIAINEAKKAFEYDEVPVGAVIVKDNKVLCCAFNLKEREGLVTKHAELIAIEQAEKMLNNWRLDDCDIYITLSPCPMCAGAIKQSRIRHVYCGLSNSSTQNTNIVENIFKNDETNKEVDYTTNICVEEVSILMNSFFKKKRNK